jgi:hypothetical protein
VVLLHQLEGNKGVGLVVELISIFDLHILKVPSPTAGGWWGELCFALCVATVYLASFAYLFVLISAASEFAVKHISCTCWHLVFSGLLSTCRSSILCFVFSMSWE